MKIERIELKNFRQYLEGKISFSKDRNKNVTIIHGVNGAGKSNLFKAINWCLYAKTDDKAEVVSKAAAHKAKVGDVINTEVRLYFSHQANRYYLSRSVDYQKKDNGNTGNGFSSKSEVFTMMRTIPGGKSEKVENKIGEINSILPENVRTYFLFDGEKIDNFSKPESGDDVKNAIYNVLKLEVIIRSKNHLEKVASDYRSELKSISTGELKELVERQEKGIASRANLILRQIELDNEIKLAKEKIARIDNDLEGIKEASQLHKQRTHLEQEQDSIGKELTNTILRIRNLSYKATGIVGNTFIEKAISIIDSKRIRGEIPSNIRNQFLQDIIDKKECICGRKFDHNSLEHQNLVLLKNKSVSGVVEEEVMNLNNGLRAIFAEAKLQSVELDREMHSKVAQENELKTLEAQIDDLARKLKDSRLEDVIRLETQRDAFKSDVERSNLEKGKNEEKIKNLDKELQQIKYDIDRARKDETKQTLLTKKINLAQGAADSLRNIYDQFADDRKKEIEEKTKEIFANLIWKENQFQMISLGADYRLEILDRWGTPASPELSAGERQLLSLAFITAMAKISGEEAPLVMDTPFSRLSKLHREKIAFNIPALADQMVLFITDEEMGEKMKDNIKERIGAEYRLKFDDSTGCTTIEPILDDNNRS